MLAASLCASACQTHLPVTRTPPRVPVRVPCCAVAGPPVEVTYLGVMGWVIRKGRTTVLTAPLFSNPDLAAAGLGTVRPDPRRIDGALRRMRVDLRGVSVILSGHGHYDHLMDVPYLMERRAPRARLLLNETSAHQIAAWGLEDRLVVVDRRAGDAGAPGEWIRVGDVRVMALRSMHGPQLAGVTLYHGERDRDMDRRPRAATEWLDGTSHAYLIDFLERGRIVFRVYYQDAVAEPPFGLVPEAMLRGGGPDARPVDLALLVPTSYGEVGWHPEAVVENVRPRHVLLGHWEDFFRSPFAAPRAMFLNDFRHFLTRLERALGGASGQGAAWHLPEAGARFLLR